MPSDEYKGQVKGSYAKTVAPVLKRDIQGQNKGTSAAGDKGQYGSTPPKK